ncbi:hypothetical protein KP78_06970 [Jeotgalibacillus soli]|uniref:Uncharacterized protein n=1 Tax=Jeotgalibacillus soli TaxID=889306 RepID=A0A0C2VZ48_9BACL|nr:hypothetical protein KP78_06970 [Jeotgalibacillus soli]
MKKKLVRLCYTIRLSTPSFAFTFIKADIEFYVIFILAFIVVFAQ